MKKVLSFLIIMVIFCPLNIMAQELNISSNNAILYHVDGDEILFEKESNQRIQIASLTKIMTALVTLENVDDLDKQVVVTYDDIKGLAEKNLVTAGFSVGSVVTYRDLLYGLLLPSGADAAQVLARNVSNNFIDLMNEKVKKLNLNNTNFSNVVGLDDENNYSTVSDLLIIFKEALRNEDFLKIITTKEYTTSSGKLIFKSTIQKNAKKYGIEVPYIEGGKTGTTDGAGLCLASVAKDNDVNLILITAGALYDKKFPHHLEDAKTIYDYYFQNYSNQKIVDKNKSVKKIKTKYCKEEFVYIYSKKNIIKYLPNNYDKSDVTYVYDGVDEISFFSSKKLGTLKIYYKDELLSEQKVYLNKKLHFSFLKFFKDNFIIFCVIVICLILMIKRAIK